MPTKPGLAKAANTPANRTLPMFQETTCLNCGRRFPAVVSLEATPPATCPECRDHLRQHASR